MERLIIAQSFCFEPASSRAREGPAKPAVISDTDRHEKNRERSVCPPDYPSVPQITVPQITQITLSPDYLQITQTRMNRMLRRVMMEGQKRIGEK